MGVVFLIYNTAFSCGVSKWLLGNKLIFKGCVQRRGLLDLSSFFQIIKIFLRHCWRSCLGQSWGTEFSGLLQDSSSKISIQRGRLCGTTSKTMTHLKFLFNTLMQEKTDMRMGTNALCNSCCGMRVLDVFTCCTVR